jgi:hypothetical protein
MFDKIVATLTDPMFLGTVFVAGLAPAVMPGASGFVVGALTGPAMLLGWLAFARIDEQHAAAASDEPGWMARSSMPRARRRTARRSRKVVAVDGGPLRRFAEERRATF